MHACILGAGIVGLATAYELQRKGWRITLIDAQTQAGMGASAGNGAQLSYAYVQPLADPAIYGQLPKLFCATDSPLKFRLKLDPHQWQWGLSFLAACNAQRSHRTTAELLTLAASSRAGYDSMLANTGIACDFAQAGKLVLLPDTAAMQSAQQQIDLQASLGAPAQSLLDADAAIAHEPALAGYRHQFAGAVYTASECVADCLSVCQGLVTHLQAGGAQWLPATQVRALLAEGGRIKAVRTSQGDIEADLFVSALGWQTPALVAPLGIRLPIYPLKGYSITVPVAAGSTAPSVSVTDSKRKVVFARLGDRVRVAGMVELVGNDTRLDPSRIDSLRHSTRAVFPGLAFADGDDLQPWTGMRPATPTGLPITERAAGHPNLWINSGHGALGFTLAFGSALRIVQSLE